MKSQLLKLTLPAIIIIVFVVQSFGQGTPPHLNPKYGADSATRVQCAMSISLYSEFYKQKNYYRKAINRWVKLPIWWGISQKQPLTGCLKRMLPKPP